MAARRVPFIPQMEAVECGAASLASVLAFWGHHAPLPEVREACKVSRDGANAASILEAARRYGLEAEAVKVEVEHMDATSRLASSVDTATYFATEPKPGQVSVSGRSLSTVFGMWMAWMG